VRSLRAASAQPGPEREDVRDPDVRPPAPRSAPRETASRRSAPAAGLEGAREKTALEVAALVRLAELDAALLRDPRRSAALGEDAAKERRELVAKLSAEVLEAYERALRAGRRPAVVRLVGSVCSGCFMRLHSKLDHQIRHRRGAAACPHCLRVVYDPSRLAA
jgi:predicted  nucleic acid-binding Zn-ribbon protein